jgi:HD-GYP domain-containing protein (c-di-GMP phosphodiesterase class II)
MAKPAIIRGEIDICIRRLNESYFKAIKANSMEQRRIKVSDVTIGQPLPWDVYDSENQLLLRKGHVVERVQQVEALMIRGLFVDTKISPRKDPVQAAPKERPSVVRLISLAHKRLERLLFNVSNEADAQAKILEVAQAIAFAADLNSDIALACILHNQTAGSYPVRHCIDTAVVSLLIARSLKKTPDEIKALIGAALTMNVGMLKQQDRLHDIQGPLSEQDTSFIRNHPQQSVTVLRAAGIDNEDWLSYVLMHHENEDGSGYPLGKKGADIPLNAKILSLADRYCARVSERNYRKSLLPNAALRDILVGEKDTMDPMLATIFIKELGVYPTGTFVRLENGEVGVVTGKGSKTISPIVHALIGPRGAPLSFPIKRDTSKQLFSIREVLTEDQANVRFSMQQVWGNEASL